MTELQTNIAELVSLGLDDEQAEYLDNLMLEQMLSHTVQIFGDEFAKAQSKHLGIHRYKQAYLIKSAQDEILLNIGIGGQNNTVFWGLTGTGCKHAKDGWELRLHDFLHKCVNAHISRIDLAHDDLHGKYSSFELANTAETHDQFVLPMTRNRPACTIFGEYKHGDPKKKG